MSKFRVRAKRLMAAVMATAMMLSSMPTSVFATDGSSSSGNVLCEHHQSHTEDCGYKEAVTGVPCGHEHSDCMLTVTQCVHVHDENCGYAEAKEAVEGNPCECPAVDGVVTHELGCGFVEAQEAVEASPCTHSCSTESGCITESCSHVHDADCGYVAAVEASPCSFVCEECKKVDNEVTEGSGEDTVEVDPVTALFDTLMAFETYEELGDYMDNMSEEEYQLMAQFSDEQNSALQARVEELSENDAEVLPSTDSELDDVKKELPDKLLQHLDVRLPGASITISTDLIDYVKYYSLIGEGKSEEEALNLAKIDSVKRTIAAQVNKVHSIVMTNIYTRGNKGGYSFQSSAKYTDFERNVDAVIENRQDTNFYVTSSTTATITVDLIDNDGNIYENVVLTYDYNGIARAAMNCDTYVTYNGRYYGGLDFNPATNTEFTSRYINYVIPVVKVWDDAGYEILRPDSLTINLYANESNTPLDTLALNSANDWKGYFENLDYQDEAGKVISYRVEEDKPDGYKVSGPTKIDNFNYSNGTVSAKISAYQFTNTPTSVSIPVTKVWDDNNNQDGKRPDSVTVRLMDGTTEVSSVVLSNDNDWKGEFTNVDPSKTYTVTEAAPDGYTLTKVEGSNSTGYTVTNTLTPETVDITVTKQWVNTDASFNIESMQFHLRKNGVIYGGENTYTITKNQNGEWTTTITDLPKYEGGKEIAWTVVEHEVPAVYDVTYNYGTGNTQVAFTNNKGQVTIVNTYSPETKAITVQKLWAGDKNYPELRPDFITVALYQKVGENGTWVLYNQKDNVRTLNAENSWRDVWSDLPAHDNNNVQYYYGVAEVKVADDGTVTIINDGKVEGKNGATYKPTYVNRDDNSENNVDGAVNGTVVITNTLDTVVLNVEKKWEGTVPSGSVTVNVLKADGATADTLTLNNENGWKATTAPLPANETYTVQEAGVENGEVTIKIGEKEHTYTVSQSYSHANGIWTITNSEVVDIPVTKVWDDNSNAYGKRPTSVTVQLLKDNTAVEGKTLTLSEANNWFGNFDNLPAGNYSVKEVVEDSWKDFYAAGDAVKGTDGGYTITNTINKDAVSVRLVINKTWYGDVAADEIPWGNVHFLVRQNGTLLTEDIDYTVTKPTSGTTGQIIIEGLPKYNNTGHEYIYTIREDTTGLDGWVVSSLVQTADTEHTYSLVNTRTMRIGLRKIWDDNSNQDGKRPEKLTFTLYQNNDLFHQGTIDVSGDSDDVYENMYINLPMYDANGNLYTYTVEEEPVEGYTSSSSIDDTTKVLTFNETEYTVEYVVVFTNTHTPETVDVEVYKTWDDAGDQDGKRPDEVVFGLYEEDDAGNKTPVYEEDGTTQKTVTVTSADNWAVKKFTGLPAKEQGTAINYTVKEIGHAYIDASGNETTGAGLPSGYTATIAAPVVSAAEGNRTYQFHATNTHTPETVDVTVTKNWADSNNVDGKRPTSITFELMADGNFVESETISADASGKWEGTFTDLPKYANGKEITYTVVEIPIGNGYTTSYSTGTVTNGGITIEVTNTRTQDTIDISGEKIWDDQGNKYRTRPDSITVNLLADGQPATDADGKVVAAKTVTTSNNWAYSFTNLPKNKLDNGVTKEIVYTVTEDAVSGYDTTISGYNITNTLKTINISGTKVWDDADNQDGLRPTSVELKLVKVSSGSGKEIQVGETLNLTRSPDEGDTWAYVFENVPALATGESYKVVEANVPAGYEVSYDGYQVTNKHTPAKTTVTVEKKWDKIPTGVTPTIAKIQLVKNGVDRGDEVTLNASTWKHTWTDLPLKESGKVITWTVREVFDEQTVITVEGNELSLREAFTIHHDREVNSDGSTSVTVTNTFDLTHRSAIVEKIWDDANDQDGKRPSSITVQLQYKAAGDENWNDVPATSNEGIFKDVVGKVTLNSENNWRYIWEKLPQYQNPNTTDATQRGAQLLYQVREVTVPTGYNSDIESLSSFSWEITNTHDPATTTIPVTKVWNDDNNVAGVRPNEIILRLKAQTVESTNTDGTQVLSDPWEVSHVHLVKEKIAGMGSEYAQATVISDGNTWTYTFHGENVDSDAEGDGLPVYKDGKQIVYTVVEDAVAGYNLDSEGVAQVVEGVKQNGSFVVTNTRQRDTINISGEKTWNDQDNAYGTRPTSITVQLKADGNVVEEKTVTLDGQVDTSGEYEAWRYEFEDLLKYKAGQVGQEIVYTVQEEVVPGYTTTYNGYNITNTLQTVDIPAATKVWNDNNNQDGKRPASITVKVQYRAKSSTNEADWTDLSGKSLVLDASNNGKAGFLDLPTHLTINSQVVEVEYRVVESNMKQYNIDTDADMEYIIHVDKNNDGMIDVGEYDYVVDQVGTPDNHYHIINKHEPEEVMIQITKVWDDDNNRDGKRPDTLKIVVRGGGVDREYTMKEDETTNITTPNKWIFTTEPLPKYSGGEEIHYTVLEYIPEGYTAEERDYGTDSNNAKYQWVQYSDATEVNGITYPLGKVTITNTHTPETITITGEKIWMDNNDHYGSRPANVTVKVTLLNGTAVTGTTTTNATQNWKYEFKNLTKYSGEFDSTGKPIAIQYRVVEEPVASYTASGGIPVHGGTAANIYHANLTNTLESVDLTVKKVWDDQDNKYDTRPDSITVTITGTGVTLENNTAILSESNGWKHTFENLPKQYKDTNHVIKDIVYTVVESDVVGYTVAYKQGNTEVGSTGIQFTNDAATVTVLNTLETVDIDGGDDTAGNDIPLQKAWNDEDNKFNNRPESITLTLKTNDGADVDLSGVETVKEVKATDNWSYSWLDLPMYDKNGNEITYTVEEAAVPGYVSENGTAANSYVVTNSTEPTSIGVVKVWDDMNNQYGLRPESVSVQLYAGEEKFGQPVELHHKNSWSHQFTNLPTYIDGKPAVYSVKEEVPVDYEASYEYPVMAIDEGTTIPTITITNTLIKNTINVQKNWNGGVGANSIDVKLTVNGEDQVVTLNPANGWKASFEVYGAITEIKAEELNVPSNYSSNITVNYDGNYSYDVAVTNTYVPPYTPDEDDDYDDDEYKVIVKKVWVGGDEENRPDVKVQLYRNGKKYRDVATLKESKISTKNWRYVWEDVNDNGDTEWSVKELEVPAGYKAEVTKVRDNYFIVTNTWVEDKPNVNTGA